MMSALDLARLQFAFTISAHIIFPAASIGIASYLAVLEALWLRSGNDLYLRVFNYWLRIFAVVFGMGVVSGIVMSYQFGTNWSQFADKTGPVIGPLMGYEVLSAFFLEAGFLGVMLFGRNRVGRWWHFLATAIVAVGTLFSAFWILSVNSRMHTPAGYAINAEGQFIVTDWWAVIFNPSFPYRLVHMVLAAYLTTAFMVGAVGAYHLLKDRGSAPALLMFSMALWMAALVTPIQIFAGDQHGLNTLEYQPMKVAAMEGHYETQSGAPLILFGWPDNAAVKTHYALEIPKLGSLILTHDLDGTVPGLKAFPPTPRWCSGPSASWSGWALRCSPSAYGACSCAGAASSPKRPGCSAPRWRWGRPASLPCWRAGSPPSPAASPTPSTACCAPPTACRRLQPPPSVPRSPPTSWSTSPCSAPEHSTCCG